MVITVLVPAFDITARGTFRRFPSCVAAGAFAVTVSVPLAVSYEIQVGNRPARAFDASDVSHPVVDLV